MTEASNDRLTRIEDRLVRAERNIATGEAHISCQKAAIVERARIGRDTTKAIRMLQIMRDTLALMHRHRDIILREREQAIQAPCVPPPTNLERCPP